MKGEKKGDANAISRLEVLNFARNKLQTIALLSSGESRDEHDQTSNIGRCSLAAAGPTTQKPLKINLR